MTTHLLTSPRFLEHDMGVGHPERPARIAALHKRLAVSLPAHVVQRSPEPAPVDAIIANHDAAYVERLRQLSDAAQPVALTADTSSTPASYDCALLASGGALAAADAVIDGHADNALCLHRPPGHHAEHAIAMGFCFFNHIAIAARHMRTRGLDRVAIIDWDVHHGNGTQNAFYDDPTVFFFSMHQWPHYPGTGRADETGAADGTGTTLNVPLPAGQQDADYLAAMQDRLAPALQEFAPQALLISAGFDAHRQDPLGDMNVTEDGFGAMTQVAVDLAGELCDGRLVSLLEGGYDLQATTASVEAHLQILAGVHGQPTG